MTKAKRHIDKLISPYIDNELTKNQRGQFEAHLEECSRCRQLFHEHQKAAQLIHNFSTAQKQHMTTEVLLAYRDGKISPWQGRVVESHLSFCQSCRRLLEATEALDEARGEQSLAKSSRPGAPSSLRAVLEGFLNKKRLIPAIAALATIILVLILFLPESNRYEPLAQIDPAPYIPAEIRGEQDESRIIFQSGMEHYLDGDYAAAEHFLEEAVRSEPNNPQFLFFYGVTLLLNHKYKRGLGYLTRTSLHQSSYREDALWYAGQAQLKLGKVEQATDNLQELAQTGGKFSNGAAELLEKIDALKD